MANVEYSIPVTDKDEDILIDIAESRGYEYSVEVLTLIDDLIKELIFKTTMKEELKMLEEKIEELIGALEANTEALLAGGSAQPRTATEVKQSITEKEQGMGSKPVSKKKSSKKTARNAKPKSSVTIEQVKAELVKIDKESAKAVLKAFNVVKLTELPPESFEDAITEAKAYMVDEAESAGDYFLD